MTQIEQRPDLLAITYRDRDGEEQTIRFRCNGKRVTVNDAATLGQEEALEAIAEWFCDAGRVLGERRETLAFRREQAKTIAAAKRARKAHDRQWAHRQDKRAANSEDTPGVGDG